jgi:hypothetical protein
MKTELEALDIQIAAARTRYLKAVWVGATVAEEVELDRVDRLLEQRRRLTDPTPSDGLTWPQP